MLDLLIRDVTVVTVDSSRNILFHGAMAVDKGRIVDVGPTEVLESKYPERAKTIGGEGQILFPGFINTHNHLFQTLLKGLGDDMVLSEWLRTMTFPAAKYLTAEDCYWASMLGCMEGIRSGITTMLDYMYPHNCAGLSDGILQAMEELQIRAVFGRGCMDTGEQFGVPREIMQDVDTIEKDLVHIYDRYHNAHDGRIKVWTAPAALWSNSEKLLKMLWRVTQAYQSSGFTVHVSETPFDREATTQLHGCAGTDCLKKLGIMGPNVLMVHCVWLTDHDIEMAAKYGLKVSYNTVSNMYLSSGVAPIPKLLKAGVPVSLGVDGAASNNGQDMLELMKSASLLQKVHNLDPTAMTAEKALEMATIDGARCLGLEDEIGSLEVGKRADFVLFDPYRNPKAVPVHNPVSTLVYSSTMDNIRTVAVDGRLLMEDGVFTVVADERAVLRNAQQAADNLAERGGMTNRGAGHRWKTI